MQHMFKWCKSFSFMTSKVVYRLFNGVFLALNCRILNNLFCVTAKGCMCQGLYVPGAVCAFC